MQPSLTIVVAASTNKVIGSDGALPWRLPEDLQRFKQITMGKPIVMGRLTHDSIGRALPGRRNIILSRQPEYFAEGCEVVCSREEALELLSDEDEVMIIGGGKIYEQFLPLATRICLTRVDAEINGDTHFPALDMDQWCLLDREVFPVTEERKIGFAIEELIRAS
jgi:dihydrofolate reductase